VEWVGTARIWPAVGSADFASWAFLTRSFSIVGCEFRRAIAMRNVVRGWSACWAEGAAGFVLSHPFTMKL